MSLSEKTQTKEEETESGNTHTPFNADYIYEQRTIDDQRQTNDRRPKTDTYTHTHTLTHTMMIV